MPDWATEKLTGKFNMTEKLIPLSNTKTAEVEGERRVRFVASTSSEDRDYEHVQIETFRIPLKGGGHIKVSELGETGSDLVNVPFLTNHDLSNVEKTIGSVRNASYVNGELIFDASISARPYAQDVFKLIDEGHLDNAFSIQFRDSDYDRDSSTYSNGEIVEVSLVTRGSNMEARVLAVKSLKGEVEVDGKDATKTAPEATEVVTDEATESTTEDELQVDNQESTTDDSQEDLTEEKSEDTDDQESTDNDDENNENNNTNKEKSMSGLTHTEAAAKQVKAPSQVTYATKSVDYLKSKEAERDFTKIIYDNYNKKGFAVKKAWADHVKAKGISGDEILPTRFAEVFFKGWEDHYEAIGTFRRTDLLDGHLYAWNTKDRGKRHKKGDPKDEQNVNDIHRDYSSVMMYKMLGLEQEDLVSGHGPELLRMRSEDLSGRLGDEAVRAIVFSDGRTAPASGQPDHRLFDGVKGPWPIVKDIDNSTTAGTYEAAVATKLDYKDSDTLYMKIVRTLSKVKGGSGRKIVFLNDGALVDLALETDSTGRLLFAPGTNFQSIFGDIYIFESPYMEGSGYDVIAYREGSYMMALGEMIVRSAYDIKYNRDMLLMERMIGGSLYGHEVAAGYPSK